MQKEVLALRAIQMRDEKRNRRNEKEKKANEYILWSYSISHKQHVFKLTFVRSIDIDTDAACGMAATSRQTMRKQNCVEMMLNGRGSSWKKENESIWLKAEAIAVMRRWKFQIRIKQKIRPKWKRYLGCPKLLWIFFRFFFFVVFSVLFSTLAQWTCFNSLFL